MLPFLLYLDWVATRRLCFSDFVEFSDQVADSRRKTIAQIQDMEISSGSPSSSTSSTVAPILLCWKANLLSLTVTGNALGVQKADETSMTSRPRAVEHSAVRARLGIGGARGHQRETGNHSAGPPVLV